MQKSKNSRETEAMRMIAIYRNELRNVRDASTSLVTHFYKNCYISMSFVRKNPAEISLCFYYGRRQTSQNGWFYRRSQHILYMTTLHARIILDNLASPQQNNNAVQSSLKGSREILERSLQTNIQLTSKKQTNINYYYYYFYRRCFFSLTLFFNLHDIYFNGTAEA